MPNSTTRENQHEQNSSFLQRRFASQPTSDIDFSNKTRSTIWGRATGYGRGRLGPRISNNRACWEIEARGNKNTNCGRFQKRRDWIRQRLKFIVKIIFFDSAIGSKNYALQEHLSKDSGQAISLYTRSNNGFYRKLSSCFFYNEQFRTTIMCDMFTEALHL